MVGKAKVITMNPSKYRSLVFFLLNVSNHSYLNSSRIDDVDKHPDLGITLQLFKNRN